MYHNLKIGTRTSKLALVQAALVREALFVHEVKNIDLVEIRTTGDLFPEKNIQSLDAHGIFVKALEEKLSEGDIDIAVHSAKDLQTTLPRGLVIGAFLPRESAGELLCTRGHFSLDTLPEGSRVGTGSLRRQGLLLACRPDVKPVPVRGNVETRLRILEKGDLDAVILSEAGLKRLGLLKDSSFPDFLNLFASKLPFVPAVGQGAIALEVRSDRGELLELISKISDRKTAFAVETEREALRFLKGGCLAPIGIHCAVSEDSFNLQGIVCNGRGKIIQAEQEGRVSQTNPGELGEAIANDLLSKGAASLLEEARRILAQGA